MAIDIRHWKFLLAENSSYIDLYEQLKRKTHINEKNENKLIKIITVLKDSGYPVEEVYESEVEQPRVETAESENIVEGRPKESVKPQEVPSLLLEGVGSSSEESSSEEDSV